MDSDQEYEDCEITEMPFLVRNSITEMV